MMQSCGFEMLYQEYGTRGDKSNTNLTNLNTVVSGQWVQKFVGSGRVINRYRRARMLYGVIQSTPNISRVSKGQVISEVKLKGHNFGMNSKARHWKFLFRVDGKSKSSYAYMTSISINVLA